MNGFKKNAMSGAYADVGAGAKPPVAGIGFLCGEPRAKQEKQPEKGCRVAVGTVTALNAKRVPISPRMAYI